MLTVAAVATFLDEFSPRRLAAEWYNVGLLVGDASRAVRKIMTCLTVTPESAAEAVAEQADLIVTHHPLLFRQPAVPSAPWLRRPVRPRPFDYRSVPGRFQAGI